MPRIKELKAEAQEAPAEVTFTFAGKDYTVATDVDLDVMEYLEEGLIVKATKALVGDDQYMIFKATRPKMSDLNDFVGEAFKAMSVSVGESTA